MCSACLRGSHDRHNALRGRGYLLVDRSDVRITVDEVTTPGTVKFYVRKRVGGMPYVNDAGFLKLL